MELETIGVTLKECLTNKLKKVATFFLDDHECTFISAKNMHIMQKELFIEEVVNKRRAAQGLPPVRDLEEKLAIWSRCAVDLIIANGFLYIRPETNKMDMAMRADAILQEILENTIPKLNIRFMYANLDAIQVALREAGEYWRIAPYPRLEDEVKKEIVSSKIALEESAIYYYSSPTGTRYVTCDEFEKLARGDDDHLRRHMIEIRDHSAERNRSGNLEIAFFATDKSFSSANFTALDFENLPASELRRIHRELLAAFKAATPPAFRRDNIEDQEWRNHMIATLVDSRDDSITGDLVKKLPSEFFRMVRWLPGGHFKGRELIFDSMFDQDLGEKPAEELDWMLDERVKGFIGNYICEFDHIEYINIGRIMPSIRRKGKRCNGHRVYLAEIKLPGITEPLLRILRVLQWGMRERLDEGADMLAACQRSLEYVDYTKQRRLACGELGMPLPARIDVKMIREIYDGSNVNYPKENKEQIWTFYFERDFIPGLATDKIPDEKLKDPIFSRNLAQLLGQAAAPNMVVGRMDQHEQTVTFDGGDEVILTNCKGIPQRLVVADHAGTFYDYTSPLETFVHDYAKPVTSRLKRLADADEFMQIYLDFLSKRLLDLQEECKTQEDAFKKRFQHCSQDAKAFSDRWNKALTRLKSTDVAAIIKSIRREIVESQEYRDTHR